jgi:hypothetical protein
MDVHDINPLPPQRWRKVFQTLLSPLRFIMSIASTREKAEWSEAETVALLNFLVEHRADTAEPGVFRTHLFNRLLSTLAPMKMAGPPKTAKMCQTKWGLVSTYFKLPIFV